MLNLAPRLLCVSPCSVFVCVSAACTCVCALYTNWHKVVFGVLTLLLCSQVSSQWILVNSLPIFVACFFFFLQLKKLLELLLACLVKLRFYMSFFFGPNITTFLQNLLSKVKQKQNKISFTKCTSVWIFMLCCSARAASSFCLCSHWLSLILSCSVLYYFLSHYREDSAEAEQKLISWSAEGRFYPVTPSVPSLLTVSLTQEVMLRYILCIQMATQADL